VRPAERRDLDRVAALWGAITVHHAAFDPVFRMRPDADAALAELIRALHRDPSVAILVYDEDGDLPGMCIVRIDRAPPILEETRRAEITDLGVREDARRRGIGATLADAALRWVSDADVVRVEVRVASGNAEGQAFWRALGFDDLMDVLHKRL
jgi:ribosomal protein S18 acetylase RimI-like enzyme